MSLTAVNKHDLKIDWATYEAAKYACLHWHYSKSIPVPLLVILGAWEASKFIGVVIFSRGASSNLLKPYGLKQDEGCELTRVALSKHKTEVSRIIKIAIAFLKKSNTRLKLVVSFADPQYGHNGGIYQARNWVYSGTTSSSKEFWYKGKRLHSRQVSPKGYNIQHGVKRKTVTPAECKIVRTKGKHRYLMPLDKATRKQLNTLSKPYPKRAGSETSDTLSSQLSKGGATPTPALHFSEDLSA